MELLRDCPRGTLPDNGVCIPVPASASGLPRMVAEQMSHRNRHGDWTAYEQIPRRPERPAAYERYRLPLDGVQREDIVSGYDLHAADAYQRRGPNLHSTGHGGLDIVALRGTPVRMVPLEAQEGTASVLYVGELFGNTVVTRHRIREAGELRDYLVLFGHLERPAPGLASGMALDNGELVGTVGDSGSPGAIHLHLEVRQVRRGVEPLALGRYEMTDNARSVACDPRNILRLDSR